MANKLLSYDDVKKQSEAVFRQFGESKWIPYAQVNAAMERADMDKLQNVGIGKILVLAAMGESTEEAIPTLIKYRDRFDLMVNDKMFGYMTERGIVPDYVMLCDASIPFRWIEKHIDKTEGVNLIATPYANTEWTKAWRGPKYFYVAEDAIHTEKIFLKIMGTNTRVIPAASNVSNAMVVFMLGANNQANINWAGYDKYLLAGYDYSWRPGVAAGGIKTGKYYAFEDPKPKRYYMNHRTLLDINNDWVHTSENLLFSAKWLISYLNSFRPPVSNCSGRGLLDIPYRGPLDKMLEKIDSSIETVESIRRQFQLIGLAHEMLRETKSNFEKSRGAIYGRR